MSAIVIFLLFFFVEILFSGSALSAYAALVFFVLHAVRLAGWHTPGIWKRPLLWSLFAAFAFLVSGFLLHAFSRDFGWNPFLSLHTFAAGGIGVITMSMMAPSHSATPAATSMNLRG